MAHLRTTITELVTGLGMLGHDDIEDALAARPAAMVSVSPEQWEILARAHAGGAFDYEFRSAFANGRSFLEAQDGLRGRRPLLVEWKGAQSNPGDEVLPVDLRIDHVFLISCKYLSKIVHNAAPQRVFDQSLRSQPFKKADWYSVVALDEHAALYAATATCCGVEFPVPLAELSTAERRALQQLYPKRWSDEVDARYLDLCRVVSVASAERWRSVLSSKSEKEATLWRLLRFGPAPYFVLGTSPADALRLRIATPWDWRQQFELKDFAVEPKHGGQPMVSWSAVVRDRHSGELAEVHGHVEVRWSHGRFGGPPEAKVYLDTPHHLISGYFPLA
jgi:hypothetical protein